MAKAKMIAVGIGLKSTKLRLFLWRENSNKIIHHSVAHSRTLCHTRKMETTKHTAIRLPILLVSKLADEAKKNNRTLSGEIIHRLLQSFKRGAK